MERRNTVVHESGARLARFPLEAERRGGPDYHYWGVLFPFVYWGSVEEVAKLEM